MTRISIKRWAGALTAVAALLAGCGGGESGEAATTAKTDTITAVEGRMLPETAVQDVSPVKSRSATTAPKAARVSLGELSMEAFETVKPFAAKGAVASLAAFRLEQLTNLTGFCAVTLKAEVDANGAIVAAAVDDTFVASNSGAGAPCDLGSDPLPPDVIPDFMSSLDRRKPGTQIGFTVFRKGQFLRMRSETDTANFGLAN